MRVLLISKACLVGAYQRKLEEIAAHPDVELTVAVPPEWRDERGVLTLERSYTHGYNLVVTPIAFNGNFHLHFYPQLSKLFQSVKPHIAHIDEEPYNFATWHALRLALRHGATPLFFSWQNLNRRYPFPFSAIESDVLHHARYALCGNADAAQVWRNKGYRGPLAVFPQFGIDPDLFAPPSSARPQSRPFTIAFAGRFVPEKGADLLIHALARLPATTHLSLLGAGPQQAALRVLADRLRLTNRVTFAEWVPSTEFPRYLHTIDALVLPSRSQSNWKEQFGRVLVEAMACGVPVIGSTCGEIPNVIGEAGLVVPEDDAPALARALAQLQNDSTLYAELSRKGRERVLKHFTHRQIAQSTVRVYRELLSAIV